MLDSHNTYKRATYKKFGVDESSDFKLKLDDFEADPNAFVRDSLRSVKDTHFKHDLSDTDTCRASINGTGWFE